LASGAAIRDAATALFLERGYDGTSMDDIAAAAKVSKQTIYTHFSDKESLFASLILANADRAEAFLATVGETVLSAADVATGLRELAQTYLRFVVRPEVLRLRRLVISQAGRFPELARTYYERVPQRMYTTLATLFDELNRRGDLRADDAERAAQHFAWLVLGVPLDRGMFIEPRAGAVTQEVAVAEAAVRVFLAAYGP
jgi:TetR/AcrR family transcriptional repressor of mexJK operon